jgi:uncharacterized protein involved in type VI secretion and phage assembly
VSHPYPAPSGQPYFGLYPALVTDIVDPDRLGRVEVKFPWLGGSGVDEVRAWATLLSPYADDDQGLLAYPEVGSQVVVGFEAGELRRPYVVGACWNGKEMVPVTATKPNNRRLLKSRAASMIEFDDTDGSVKVTVSTDGGHKVVLDEGSREVKVLHADGSKVVITSTQVQVTANATVEINASAVNVHAPAAVFDGTITCTQITCQTGVVSPSYTPGAGNVW